MQASLPISLGFSQKYNRQHAEQYFAKHQDGLARKLSHWRDEQMVRKALHKAGDPGLVLDLPCGAGRFWPLLAEHGNRVILAADYSADMLAVATANQPEEIARQVRIFQTSAFDIQLDENSVDCILCMRLLHHIESSEHRSVLLRELCRVTRDTVIISLWVDGNYKSWRRRRLETQRAKSGKSTENQNRFIIPRRTVEHEFKKAGFKTIASQDFLPGYAMWRVYTLRKDTSRSLLC